MKYYEKKFLNKKKYSFIRIAKIKNIKKAKTIIKYIKAKLIYYYFCFQFINHIIFQ